MEKMLRAIVQYAQGETTKDVEQDVITKKEQLADYKRKYPLYYSLVKENFLREIKQGNFILVNSKGGWCTQSEDIKIIRYITN